MLIQTYKLNIAMPRSTEMFTFIEQFNIVPTYLQYEVDAELERCNKEYLG